jgi:hypothetical protein
MFGVPGFFVPRFPPPSMAPVGSIEAEIDGEIYRPTR